LVTPTIPSTEPTKLTRGDSTVWTRAFSEYLPADGWTLKYYFGSSTSVFSITAADNGDGSFLATVATIDSKKFAAGRWTWQAVVTKAAESITLDTGAIDIVDGLSLTASGIGVDLRSQNRIMLDALIATLQGRATSDQLSMSYNGRSLSRSSIAELREWRTELEDMVRVEEQGEQAGLGRDIRVRMSSG
jgi:hypothetical protein